MSERLTASHEHYPELNRLQEMLILLTNIEIAGARDKTFVAGQLVDIDVAEPELKAIKATIVSAIDDLLDKINMEQFRESVFAEFIESL